MKKSEREEFTAHSILTFGTQLVALAGTVGSTIIMARNLGPEGRGQLGLVLLVPMLSTTLGRLGIGHAVNYYASKVSVAKLIAATLVLSAGMSAILVAIAMPSVCLLKGMFFRAVDVKFLVVISLCIPAYVFENHLLFLLQGQYRIKERNVLVIIESGVQLLLTVVLVLVLGLGLVGGIVATVSPLILTDVLSLVLLFRSVQWSELAMDTGLMRKLLTFGAKTHVGNILKDLTYRGDILLVSYFLTDAAVGYYVAAVTVSEVVWRIPDAVGMVLLARASAMREKAAASFTPFVCRRVVLPVCLACIALFLLAKYIILTAFGAAYEPSIRVLILLIPGILSFSIWKILANVLIGQGHPTKYSVTAAIGLVSMIAFDVLLIPRMGINGAAVASSLSYILSTVSIVLVYTRVTGTKTKTLLLPTWSDVAFYKDISGSLVPAGWRR